MVDGCRVLIYWSVLYCNWCRDLKDGKGPLIWKCEDFTYCNAFILYRPKTPNARTPSAPTPTPRPSLLPNPPFPTFDLGHAVCDGHAELVGLGLGVHVEDATP